MGDLTGKEPEVIVREIPGTLRGSVIDTSLRTSITGPCEVGWKDGVRRTYEARHGAEG
jgi:hypothetical protein